MPLLNRGNRIWPVPGSSSADPIDPSGIDSLSFFEHPVPAQPPRQNADTGQ